MLNTLLKRAAEPSTWAGLAGLAIAAGLTEPEWTAISGVLAAVAAAIAVFLPEKKA